MRIHLALLASFCWTTHAQTNFTFGPLPPTGNVPPPYIATGVATVGSTPVVPYTPITTDGWGNLSSLGAMMSYAGIGGQGLTISQGGQSLLTFAVQNNTTTGTVTNQLACWDGSGNAVNCPATTASVPASKVIGLVYLNGGTGGTAGIVRAGTAPCIFDTGSVAVGDYVVASSSSGTPGYCHDAGSVYPAGSQPVGIVTAQGFNSVNYVFVMNDVLALSPGPSGNMTITGGQGLQAAIDIVNNPAFSTSVTSPLYTSPGSGGLAVTAAGGGALSLSTSASTSAATGAVAISSGANGGTGGTGNVTIDAGATAISPGQVQIGVNNASAVSVGNAGATTTVNGPLTVVANKNLVLQPGTGEVGIGDATPGAKLSVVGNAAIGYSSGQTAPPNGLVVNGSVGIGTTGPQYPLDINGNTRQSNLQVYGFTRTLPTSLNQEVDIGYFTFSNGGGSLWVSVTVPSTGYSVSKEYLLPVQYNQAPVNTWVTALPISNTGSYSGNDFALDVNVNANVASLRLRNIGGSTSGTAYVTVRQEGVNTDAFTPSTATSTVLAPTALFTSTALTQVGGNVGIGTTTPMRLFEAHVNAPGLESDFLLQNDNYSVTDAGTGMVLAGLDSTGATQVLLGGIAAYFNDSNSAPSYNGVVGIREQINGYLLDVITLAGGNVGIGVMLATPPLSAPVTLPALLSVGSTSQFQVNSSGVVANYDSIPTQGLGLSPILASPARLTGKTASIGSTTLCGSTTCTAGLYSVEYYLNCSTAGTGGTVVVAITWNDGANQSFSSASVPLASTGYAQGQVTLYSAGTVAISYSTTVTGAAGSPQYALSLSVPRLQ